MRVIDYIIRQKKLFFVFASQLPKVREEVKNLIENKYNNVEFDSELLDLIELSDKINGG
jgi:hypothetical protein